MTKIDIDAKLHKVGQTRIRTKTDILMKKKNMKNKERKKKDVHIDERTNVLIHGHGNVHDTQNLENIPDTQGQESHPEEGEQENDLEVASAHITDIDHILESLPYRPHPDIGQTRREKEV